MTDYYRVEEPLLTKKVILVPKVAYLFRLCSAAIGVGLGVIATVVFSGAVVRPPSSPLPISHSIFSPTRHLLTRARALSLIHECAQVGPTP
jgi:hypothetical protein